MSQLPWWLTAIIFFFVGLAVERFIIDRKFIRYMNDNLATLAKIRDGRGDVPLRDDHGDAP